MNKLKVILLLLILSVGNIHSQNLLSLKDAVNIALQKNTTVKIAENNLRIAENNYQLGNADFLPKFDLNLSTIYNDNYNYVYGMKKYSAYTTNIASIKASYILFNGMRNFATYSKYKYYKSLSQFATKATREKIALEVIRSYNEVAKLQENLFVAKESMEISRDRMNRQKSKMKFGHNSSIDYLSSVVDFNKDSLNFIYVSTLLKQQKQKLNKLLNRNINEDFIVDTNVVYKELPTEEKLIELALKNNSNYNTAKEQVKISEEEKSIANSVFYPNLVLESAYGYNKIPDEFSLDFENPNKTFYAGVSLQFNIFNGFKNKIQSQNAEILLENSKISLREAELNIRTELSNAYLSYVNSKTALQLEYTNLKSAKLNFERTKELYDLGKVTLTQFREAQLKFMSAKQRISELKYSLKNAEANLLLLSGLLLPMK